MSHLSFSLYLYCTLRCTIFTLGLVGWTSFYDQLMMRNHWKFKHISSAKGEDNPFQIALNINIFFRQWKSTFVDRDLGVMLLCQSDALAALNCFWHLSISRTKLTWWREKNTNIARLPLGLEKGQKKGINWHPSWRCLSFLFLVFAFHLFLLLFVVSLNSGSWEKHFFFLCGLIKNMCNIHTKSPLNFIQKIKMLFLKVKI